MSEQDAALYDAARARDAYIDALTDVATQALRKAGLLSISESRHHDKLRDAIAYALM